METVDKALTVVQLVHQIKPILAGHLPEVQGAVLADLLALWLAGSPPDLRPSLLDAHLTGAVALVPVNEEALFGGRHPFDTSETH